MTPSELKARVQRDYPGEQWHNGCAGFAYYVCRVSGTVKRSYVSATAAYLDSEIVSTDPNAAPASAVHFWKYQAWVSGIYADWGHVAISTGGGYAAMTDPEDWESDWGNDLGVTHVASWTANRTGIVTYRGWAYTYGANTANITNESTAGGDAKPFPEDDMGTIDDNEQNYQTFAKFAQRYFQYDVREKGFGPDWKLGPTIWEKIAQSKSAPVTDAQVKAIADAVVAAVGKPNVSIDYAAIAKAVNDDAAKRLAN